MSCVAKVEANVPWTSKTVFLFLEELSRYHNYGGEDYTFDERTQRLTSGPWWVSEWQFKSYRESCEKLYFLRESRK